MVSVCDRDCFHCKYDDCILEELEAEDYAEQRRIEREIVFPKDRKGQKRAAYQRAYYEANKDEIAAKKRAYREANKDELAAKQRAYREANKDELAAKQRAYREANKEKYNEYMRNYQRRRREAAKAGNA